MKQQTKICLMSLTLIVIGSIFDLIEQTPGFVTLSEIGAFLMGFGMCMLLFYAIKETEVKRGHNYKTS